jgi:hypothetical protein
MRSAHLVALALVSVVLATFASFEVSASDAVENRKLMRANSIQDGSSGFRRSLSGKGAPAPTRAPTHIAPTTIVCPLETFNRISLFPSIPRDSLGGGAFGRWRGASDVYPYPSYGKPWTDKKELLMSEAYQSAAAIDYCHRLDSTKGVTATWSLRDGYYLDVGCQRCL